MAIAGLAVCVGFCSQSRALAAAPPGGLNISATCRDVAAIRTLNRQLDSGSPTLARKRKTTRSLKAAADTLIEHVTDDTSTDARTYRAGVATLLEYTLGASSVQELRLAEKYNVELKSALADASASLRQLVSWYGADCR